MEDPLPSVLLDDLDVKALDEGEDLVLGSVTHLDVELGVLGLPITTLILIA